MWWDKRLALWAGLKERGHLVVALSKPTTESAGAWVYPPLATACDLLMLEFAGSNPTYFAEDLAATWAIIRNHKGPVVFLCDDPDLLPEWGDLETDYRRWQVWWNCLDTGEGVLPAEVEVIDAPFGGLLGAETLEAAEDDTLAYIGRTDGRVRRLRELLREKVPFVVYGRGKEWDEFGGAGWIRALPRQPLRRAILHRHLGVLGLADARHRAMGWRTGRIFHGIAAGVPAIVELGHRGLAGILPTYSNGAEARRLAESYRADPNTRHEAWQAGVEMLTAHRAQMGRLLDGLPA